MSKLIQHVYNWGKYILTGLLILLPIIFASISYALFWIFKAFAMTSALIMGVIIYPIWLLWTFPSLFKIKPKQKKRQLYFIFFGWWKSVWKIVWDIIELDWRTK